MNELRKLPFVGATIFILIACFVELKYSSYGVAYLSLIDGFIFFSLVLMWLSIIWSNHKHIIARGQGLATLIFSFTIFCAAIGKVAVAIGKLSLMLALLLAVPFGTLVYLAKYSNFPKTEAIIILGSILLFKLLFFAFLVLADRAFLTRTGILFLIGTSSLLTIIVSSVLGIVPGILGSIADAILGIIVGIVAIIWAIVMFLGSVPSIVKALKPF